MFATINPEYQPAPSFTITLEWPGGDEPTTIEPSASSIEAALRLAEKYTEPGVTVSLTNSAGVVEWKA